MKKLHVIVANKIATYSQRGGDIVCGNSDYQIEFTFDDEWGAYSQKTARFIWNGKSKDVVFTGTLCPVPILANTDRLEVGVFVENLSTTTSAVIACKKSIRCNTDVTNEGTVQGGVDIDTFTMRYTMGSDPLGIIYSNGTETKLWADTPKGENITVACNVPIVFYNPQGNEALNVTLSANGSTIQPYFSNNTQKVYSIPSEYKNTHITISL